jgi:hypothetical protein
VSSAIEKTLAMPNVQYNLVEPLMKQIRPQVYKIIKDELGPYVIGIGLGLVLLNIFLLMKLANR